MEEEFCPWSRLWALTWRCKHRFSSANLLWPVITTDGGVGASSLTRKVLGITWAYSHFIELFWGFPPTPQLCVLRGPKEDRNSGCQIGCKAACSPTTTASFARLTVSPDHYWHGIWSSHESRQSVPHKELVLWPLRAEYTPLVRIHILGDAFSVVNNCQQATVDTRQRTLFFGLNSKHCDLTRSCRKPTGNKKIYSTQDVWCLKLYKPSTSLSV